MSSAKFSVLLLSRWVPVASADVSECPCTLVFQSPADVYRSTGQSVVLPELLKSLNFPGFVVFS